MTSDPMPGTVVGTALLPGGSLQQAVVHIVEGRIAAVDPEPTLDPVRSAGVGVVERLSADEVLTPAFVDVHCHGAGGGSAHGDAASLQRMAVALRTHGVGAFVATTMTAPIPTLRQIARLVTSVRAAQAGAGEESAPALEGREPAQEHPGGQPVPAQLLGLHLEGPAIAPARSAGHDLAALLPPRRLAASLADAPEDWLDVRVVTLAPELEGGLELVRRLANAGAVASLGHTDADAALMTAAYAAGARSTTHLFNGMPPLHHRHPGPVGAALAAAPFIELICDGVHVAGSLLAPLAQAIGAERLLLVSDALPLAGSRMRRVDIAGITARIEGDRAVDAEGNLAGSRLLLDGMLAGAVRHGIPLGTALRAATENPARMLRLTDRGVIATGAVADLIVVSDDGRFRRTLGAGDGVAAGGVPHAGPG